ncbi:MAG: riboflavin biosynthesis protein RibD [Puniceicoccaceae bacterium]|nr:riboflavin biosynthesis protein RibD [Puniceicoccaceae bacterium]
MSTPTSVMKERMQGAIALAKKAWGQTDCNPMVGARIFEKDRCLAEAYHQRSGGPHAEVLALDAFEGPATDETELYITLEPCSTKGRTGACTDVIIRSGIKRVVVGTLDPNPLHQGKGIAVLKAAGIDLITGIEEEACRELNMIYNHWIQYQRPFCAMKFATTLDGCLSTASGQSNWITSERARNDVMRWRRLFPSIAVSHNTLCSDNPQLTSRLSEANEFQQESVHCPIRFVFNRQLRGIEKYDKFRLFQDAFADQTIIVHADTVSSERLRVLQVMGFESWSISELGGQLSMESFFLRCAEAEIPGVYIEPGARLASQLLANGWVDYLFVYQASKLLLDSEAASLGLRRKSQSMDECLSLHSVVRKELGADYLTRGYMKK